MWLRLYTGDLLLLLLSVCHASLSLSALLLASLSLSLLALSLSDLSHSLCSLSLTDLPLCSFPLSCDLSFLLRMTCGLIDF